MLTRPLVSATLPAGLTSPFAAVHVRRGDKTEGYTDDRGQIVIEGDEVAPQVYVKRLIPYAPEIKSIFVMTDDYRVIDDFRKVGRDYSIHTLCRREETGYSQLEFSSLDPVRKTDQIRRLIAETNCRFIGRISRRLQVQHRPLRTSVACQSRALSQY